MALLLILQRKKTPKKGAKFMLTKKNKKNSLLEHVSHRVFFLKKNSLKIDFGQNKNVQNEKSQKVFKNP